jgi:RNA polymerase sigma-70 factor (ECF subfamily)
LNLCRDYGRKKKLAQFFSIDDEESGFNFADSSPDPEAIAQSSQAVRQINQAIDTLPHKLKTALILFALDDDSQEECAQMLGVTAKTIETRVHRARKLLEEKLYKNR